MRHIILASHHKFAAGLADTIEFIGGISEFDVICAYVDETPLDVQVKVLFDGYGVNDEVLILTDIMQGSVNQAFAPYMNGHVFLVSGVNVACALELVLTPEPLTYDAIEEVLVEARNSMQLMNRVAIEAAEGDE
ncbi:MAG: hypothetical protein LKI40_02990 [Olsenella sp.]|nr:hypothetical protein [Olsenella sp.]MCI1645174.1 hypothetical protein [Olsenella sp.]MCI1878659.1 hypothetical protein [Olsenella sp.]